MKTCPVCGAQAADDAKFCFSCGNSFITEAAPAEPEKPEAPAEPVQQEAPVPPAEPIPPVQPEAPVPPAAPLQEDVPPKKLLLNTFQYMMLMVLFSIPVIGLIFLFVWGAGHPKNPSLKRFSAAVLLWRLILAVLLVGGLLAMVILHGHAVQEALNMIVPGIKSFLAVLMS